MKKTAENRYPSSATLFSFCKKALAIRYKGNVKVIDQDVGAILGYDPADCSHWKKGKKNIRSLDILRTISEHLNVDERFVIDITSGRIQLDEAIFEYVGYGDFSLKQETLENLKKKFYKNPNKLQHDGSTKSFDGLFDLDRASLLDTAQQLISQGHLVSPPILVPEIFRLFPSIHIDSDKQINSWMETREELIGEDKHFTVYFREDITRPYIRFAAIKELFKCLCQNNHHLFSNFSSAIKEVIDVQSNVFAGMLLIPPNMLQHELDNVDYSTDIIVQLADRFLVSKSLMNKRLNDYMTHYC